MTILFTMVFQFLKLILYVAFVVVSVKFYFNGKLIHFININYLKNCQDYYKLYIITQQYEVNFK